MKWVIIVMSAVLALIVSSEIVLYRTYQRTRNELVDTRQTTAALSTKKLQMDEEISKLKNQIDRKEKQIKVFEDVEMRVLELKNKLQSKDRHLSDFEKKLESATQRLGQDRQKIDDLDSELSLRRKDISMLQKQVEDGDVQIASLRKTVDTVRFDNRDLRRQLKLLIDEKDHLLKKIGLMSTTHNEAVSQLQKTLQARDDGIEDLREHLDKAVSENESLNAALGERQNKISALAKKNQESTAVSAELQNKLDRQAAGYTTRIADLESDQQIQEERILNLKRKLKESDVHLLSASENLKMFQKTITRQAKTILGLEKESTVLSKQVRRLESTHHAAVSRLQESLQDRDAGIESLEGRLKISESEKDALSAALSGSQAEISALQGETRVLAASTDQRIKELNAQIGKQSTRITELQMDLQIRDERILNSRRQVKETDARLHTSTEHLAALRKTITNREVKITALEKETADLNGMIHMLKSGHDVTVSRLKEQLQARDADNKSLGNRLKRAEADKDSLEAMLSERQAKISELLDNARDSISVMNDLRDAFHQQKSNHAKSVSALEAELKHREVDLTGLQDRLEKTKAQLKSSEETVSSLHKEIDIRNVQTSARRQEKEVLKDEIGRLRTAHSKRLSILNGELEAKNIKIQNLEKKILLAESKIETLDRDMVSGKKEIDRLQESARNLDIIKEDLKRRLHGSRRHHETAVSEKEALKRQLDQSRKDYEAAVSDLNRDVADRDAQILSLGGQLKEQEMLGVSLKTQVSSNASKAATYRKQMRLLQKELGTLKAGFEKRKQIHEERISRLQAEIKNREDMIQKLRNQLTRAETLALSLNDEMKEGQSRQDKLNALLHELEQKEGQLQTRIDRLQSEYTAMTAELKEEITAKDVTIQKLEEKLSITFVDRILFDTGKTSIGSYGKKALNKVGALLKKVQNKSIRVIGHTDNIPIRGKYRAIYPSNWELSSARAAAVVRYFQYRVGLDPLDLEVVGRSHYDPVAGNHTPEGRLKNRRVNIIIAPKPEYAHQISQ